MQIYIPTPVVVDDTLHFQARIPHDGYWIVITKPSNALLTLRYGKTNEASIVVPHDKYYNDPDNGVHHAVYTLPNKQHISVVWIPRPMTYHHIHIQTTRLLIQVSPTSSNTKEVSP